MSTVSDVSLKLEHVRHYLELIDGQLNYLHTLQRDEVARDLSDRICWLVGDVLILHKDIYLTLYPSDIALLQPTQGA